MASMQHTRSPLSQTHTESAQPGGAQHNPEPKLKPGPCRCRTGPGSRYISTHPQEKRKRPSVWSPRTPPPKYSEKVKISRQPNPLVLNEPLAHAAQLSLGFWAEEELRTPAAWLLSSLLCPERLKIPWKRQTHCQASQNEDGLYFILLFFYRPFLRQLLVCRRKKPRDWKGLLSHHFQSWPLGLVALTWPHEEKGGGSWFLSRFTPCLPSASRKSQWDQETDS